MIVNLGAVKLICAEGYLRLIAPCVALSALLVGSIALAADADSGRRLAAMRCVPCHLVFPDRPKEVAQAPPFEAIARKFALTPEALAFSILDPHPRMNVMLTRREAEDIAAYINTLAK